ncbi:MAG: P1 family peptidase [Campylobacteraceae bacterium]
MATRRRFLKLGAAIGSGIALSSVLPVNAFAQNKQDTGKKYTFKIGTLENGKHNLITDVAGIEVGHKTLNDGEIQTGVTAIFPHKNNTFKNKLVAACHVINGFGKTLGLMQLEELGNIETPIVLTNTLNVGIAHDTLVRYMLSTNDDIGATTGTVNPIVCECNDGGLNNIRAMSVTQKDVMDALNNTSVIFEEGSVGAGRGMRCHGLKGGIGSSSRVIELNNKKYTIGALLLTNHGSFSELVIDGKNISQELKKVEVNKDKGSVIIILATDAPLCSRQLKRICKRAVIGLGRAGSYVGNGSGDLAIAFSTANVTKHYNDTATETFETIINDEMDIFFRATVDVVQESVVKSLLAATPVIGRKGRKYETLTEVLNKIKF